MKNPISDEDISAYLDNELDPRDRSLFEDAMRTDRDLKHRVEMMERIDGQLSVALPTRPIPAVDEVLADRLAAALTSTSRSAEPAYACFLQRVRQYMQNHWQPALVTAGLALSLGGILGSLTTPNMTTPDTALSLEARTASLVADGPFSNALETVPSLTPVALSTSMPSVSVKPILTFRTKSGSFCREFEIANATAISVGVACRSDEGGWAVQAILSGAEESPNGTVYRLASGQETDLLSGVIKSLQSEPALDADQERAVIARGWASGRKTAETPQN